MKNREFLFLLMLTVSINYALASDLNLLVPLGSDNMEPAVNLPNELDELTILRMISDEDPEYYLGSGSLGDTLCMVFQPAAPCSIYFAEIKWYTAGPYEAFIWDYSEAAETEYPDGLPPERGQTEISPLGEIIFGPFLNEATGTQDWELLFSSEDIPGGGIAWGDSMFVLGFVKSADDGFPQPLANNEEERAYTYSWFGGPWTVDFPHCWGAYNSDFTGSVVDYTMQVTVAYEAGPPEFHIDLGANRFELVSTCLEPEILDVPEVFSNIDNLAIVYQNDGSIYIPGRINNIGEIDPTQGYVIFCSEPSQWTTRGELLDPETVYLVEPNRWNWISYPFNYALDVEVALADIMDNLAIIMNDDGLLWIPGVINTLDQMLPGEGYFIISEVETNFVYNTDDLMARTANQETWDIPSCSDAPVPTGLPYAVLVYISEDLKLKNPATIEIYDGDILAGKSYVLNEKDFSPVITWRGSEKHNLPGFEDGKAMKIVLKSREGLVLNSKISGENPIFGQGAYAEVNLDLNDSSLPESFVLEKAYPNPFNPEVTIPFSIQAGGDVKFTIFDILGREIYTNTEKYQAGLHYFIFNAEDLDLVSGMYFVKAGFRDQLFTRKIMLLK